MLVGRAEDYTSDDPTLNPPVVEGQANPMRRDTVQIPSMNSATLRVVADNPGVWFLHCTLIPLHIIYKCSNLSIDRPHRMALGSRFGNPTGRSTARDATAQLCPSNII